MVMDMPGRPSHFSVVTTRMVLYPPLPARCLESSASSNVFSDNSPHVFRYASDGDHRVGLLTRSVTRGKFPYHQSPHDATVTAKTQAKGDRLMLGALNFGLVVSRQCEAEDGTTWLICFCPQVPAMGINDRATYREADPDSTSLCSVEGFKNPL
jgi:hypothetical protein